MSEKYKRHVQTSVTNFLYHGDQYLFHKRAATRHVDPGLLNGIGGKVEKGEDFLACCIRETKEETGYEITSEQIQCSGIVRLEGGYKDDWVMAFFKIYVPSMEVPIGKYTDVGDELIWLHKDDVLDSGYELVDDLYYCFKDIVKGDSLFFMNAEVNGHHKITHTSVGKLFPSQNDGLV